MRSGKENVFSMENTFKHKAPKKVGGGLIEKEIICDKHGKFIVQSLVLCGHVISGGCPACRSDVEASNALKSRQEAERNSQNNFMKRQSDAGIPARYLKATVENFEATNPLAATAKKTVKGYVSEFATIMRPVGIGLLFTGTHGTGKTHLGCAIASSVLKEGMTAVYADAMTILDSIKDSYNTKSATSTTQVVARYTQPDLLVIDEIGVHGAKDHDYTQLFSIINERYKNMRPTIGITNLSWDDLNSFLNERTVERIVQGGETIVFNWESRRRG